MRVFAHARCCERRKRRLAPRACHRACRGTRVPHGMRANMVSHRFAMRSAKVAVRALVWLFTRVRADVLGQTARVVGGKAAVRAAMLALVAVRDCMRC